MKRIGLAILVLGLVAALPAWADEWSKTYNLTGTPELRIETSDADIRVSTWDQNAIEAKVITTRYKIGEGGIRIEEHQDGDHVDIDVRYPHHNFNIEWGQHKVEIIVQMPREGQANLRTGDGKIEVNGLKGEMDLHTGDGGVTLEAVDGKLHATTGDGHIRAGGRSISRPAMAISKCVPILDLRSPQAGGSRPETETSALKCRGTWPPTLTCTPATGTSTSTCR
jgi:hypothetical protein